MEIKPNLFDETIWGEIDFYEMLYPDIYYVSGKRNEGYLLPKDYSGKIITPTALSFGKEAGNTLCFLSGETVNIIEYELLRYRLSSCNPGLKEILIRDEMADIEQTGRIDLSGYFGNYPPPNETPLGIVDDFIVIRNGMYFVKTKEQWLFAICGIITDSELTTMAQSVGTQKKDYDFYDLITAAIPIYELASSYCEVKALVASETALHTVLCNHFPLYVTEHPCKSDTPTADDSEDYLAFPHKSS